MLISCNKKEEKVFIVTEDSSYILLNNEKRFNVPIYLEDKYSFYMDKNQIKDVYLVNNNMNEKYNIDIASINKSNFTLNSKEYSLSKYIISFDFNYKLDNLRIPDAYLFFEYSNSETHKIKIGSFVYNNILSNNLIIVNNMKGIVNDIDHNKLSTVGILLNISSTYDIKITNIELLHGNGRINQDQLVMLDNINYDNNININELLKDEYRLNYISNSLKEYIYLNDNNSIKLILPISYNQLDVINKAGLIITYIYNDTMYYQVIKPIPIFSSSNNNNYNIYEFSPVNKSK